MRKSQNQREPPQNRNVHRSKSVKINNFLSPIRQNQKQQKQEQYVQQMHVQPVINIVPPTVNYSDQQVGKIAVEKVSNLRKQEIEQIQIQGNMGKRNEANMKKRKMSQNYVGQNMESAEKLQITKQTQNINKKVEISKKTVIFAASCFFTIFAIIQFYLIYSLSTENTRLSLAKEQNIIVRTYQKNRVYDNIYETEVYSNQSLIKTGFRLLSAVDQNKEEQTRFLAVLQKKYEKLYDINGTFIKQVIYDESDLYYKLLKQGKDAVSSPIDPNGNRTQFNASNYNLSNYTNNNNTQYKPYPVVVPVFRYGLLNNGKISNITFPVAMDRAQLGLLRGFIKMFSPLLTKDIYTNSQTVSKVKRGNPIIRRLLQTLNDTDTNSTNGTNDTSSDPNQSIYTQDQNHAFETEQNATTLNQQSSISYTGPTHNTLQQGSQSSTFSKDGQLTQGSMQSNTKFKSIQQPPSNNYSVMNFNIDYQSYQTASMNLSQKFQTKEDYVRQFQSLILHYEKNNQTMTLSVEQLINFVLGVYDQADNAPGTTRLLLNDDGSFTILEFDKQVKILMTNIIGFQIGAYGYMELRLTLYEDQKNPNKKIPKIIAGAGTVLCLAIRKVKVPVLEYTKQLPPLTLKYTLSTIQSVVNLFKGNFLGKVETLIRTILNGNFENNLVPNIMNAVTVVSDLQNAIQNQEQSNSPLAIILKILSSVSDIRAIIDSKGMDLLNPQNQFALTLMGELSSYYNVSFAEALQIFNQVKSNLALIRTQGSDYLINAIQNFTNVEIAQIQQDIRGLIPAQVYSEYQRQIEKARAIINFLTFVRQNGLQYANYIQRALEAHSTNLIGLVKHVVDLYFRNQTNITSNFTRAVNNRFNNVLTQLEAFKSLKQRVNVTEMKRRSLALFSNILFTDVINEQFKTNWRNRLVDLKATSSRIQPERGGQPCCQWKRKRKWVFFTRKVCQFWNPTFGDQAAETFHFDGLRAFIQQSFNSLSNRLTDTLTACKQIIQDNDLDLVQKFFEIKPRIEQIQSMIPMSKFDEIINNINSRLNEAQSVRNRVGCGGTGSFDSYLSKLRDLVNFVNSFRSRYNQLISVGLNVIQTFNDTVYTAIVDNTVVVESVTDFFQTYKQFEDKSVDFFHKIEQIAYNYDPNQFAKSDKIAIQVFELYGTITSSLDELCIHRDDNRTSIEAIRSIYNQKISLTSNLTNSFLSGELSRLAQFLGNGSSTLYNVYLQTPFCSMREQFQQDIATLFPDFDNFTVIFELYTRMKQVKEYTLSNLTQMKNQARSLSRTFFKLFTPDGYRNFVRGTEHLAKSFESLTDNVSLQLSYLREQAQVIYMFLMASRNQITASLQIFTNSTFTLNSYYMFENLNSMVVESLLVIDQLSFDVIAFVVAAKDVLEYFQTCKSNFEQGGQQILDSFKNLCQSFLDVSSLVNQQYLNNINQNFRNIIMTLNNTMFPNITQNMNYIITRFEDYRFHSQQMQRLFNNSMVKLKEFGVIIQNCKQAVFKKIKQFSQLVIELIEKLQIGSLNSIFELLNVIKQQFSSMISSFPSMIKQLLNFKTFVDKDFRKIFTFRGFFNNVKSAIETKYNSTMNRINLKISQTKGELQQNSRFYIKFKTSQAYNSLQQTTSTFVLDFRQLWSEADAELVKIDNFLNQITGSVADILRELNQAKQKMLKIKSNIDSRIKNIKSKYQQIRKKLFNVKSLFFISLRGDLSVTVVGALRGISEQIDKIIDIDLKAVDQIANSTLNGRVRLISQLIHNAQTAYNALKVHRDEFFVTIGEGINKIDEFIDDNVVSKFQKLKDGILFIKSKTDLEDPLKRIVLYENSKTKRAPIFNFSQAIPTIIGVFYVNLQLNYTLSARAFIALREFRSIDLGVTFEAALILQVSFSYGIARILQFGFYVRGAILRAEISPQLFFNGIIPIQLVQMVTDISEITDQNQVSIQFVIDLGIYAVEIEVGFFIKHIWIEIIWIEIDLCFDFFFFSFCISFRLPIGFKFIFVRHDWGYKVPGIAILKKRIVQLTIARWRY